MPEMRNVPGSRQVGYTLTELMIVVMILTVIAAIVVPATTSTGPEKKLELAAEEFAAAMRFARNEAIRTGEPHGFRFLTNQERIRVFSADTSGSPWTWVWNVYHPVSKQLYDYTLPDELFGAPDPIAHTAVYRSTCDRTAVVYFDASGTPWCLEPETALLDSFRLDITTNDGQIAVNLDGITGRVTVQ